LAKLGLLGTTVDVTGVVSGTWFEPKFVIAEYAGKPYVLPVPANLVDRQSDAQYEAVDAEAARALVSSLLHRYEPTARRADVRWKRAFASLLRAVHQP
jgi:hypothetical protein